MNLPNKLTVFRVILIVPFVVALLGDEATVKRLWGGTQAGSATIRCLRKSRRWRFSSSPV